MSNNIEKNKFYYENFFKFFNSITKKSSFAGVIPADEASEFARSVGVNIVELMLKLLPFISKFSKPEISKFYVGSLLLGKSGNIYLGNNIEFSGENLLYTVHAEQCAVVQALNYSEKGIEKLAVSYVPCGLCRELLKETVSADTMEIYINDGRKYMLNDLFPESFGPKDLGITDLLLEEHYHNINFVDTDHVNDSLTIAALSSARKSYAPYSKNYSGVSLLVDDNIYTGNCIENCAFNIGFDPLVPALIQLHYKNISFKRIEKAVLVEMENSVSPQFTRVQSLLNVVAPGAKLFYKKACYNQKNAKE